MEEKLVQIQIENLTIVADRNSGILYGIGDNRIAKPILVDIPYSDFFGKLIIDQEKYHEYLHKNGIENNCSACGGCHEKTE